MFQKIKLYLKIILKEAKKEKEKEQKAAIVGLGICMCKKIKILTQHPRKAFQMQALRGQTFHHKIKDHKQALKKTL